MKPAQSMKSRHGVEDFKASVALRYRFALRFAFFFFGAFLAFAFFTMAALLANEWW
jgi:hypothetical protein